MTHEIRCLKYGKQISVFIKNISGQPIRQHLHEVKVVNPQITSQPSRTQKANHMVTAQEFQLCIRICRYEFALFDRKGKDQPTKLLHELDHRSPID